MKSTITAFLILLTLIPSLVHARINLGEGSITLKTSVSAYYDSQIRSRNSDQSDYIFSLRPQLIYNRPSKYLDLSASVGVNMQRYADSKEYDDDNFSFNLDINPNIGMDRQTSRFAYSANLILNSETGSEGSVGEIVTKRNYGASGRLIYYPNQRYTLITDASYRITDPDSSTYKRFTRTQIGESLQVPINQNLSANARVSYNKTDSDEDNADNETYTYSVGLNGTMLSKLSGSASIGVQDRQFDNGDSEQSPYLSAGLGWRINDRTSANLSATNDFGTTIDGRSSESFAVNINVSRQISEELSGGIAVGYEENDFSGREQFLARSDEERYVRANLSYQVARWGSLGFDVRYSEQSSSRSEFDFNRFRAGITLGATW